MRYHFPPDCLATVLLLSEKSQRTIHSFAFDATTIPLPRLAANLVEASILPLVPEPVILRPSPRLPVTRLPAPEILIEPFPETVIPWDRLALIVLPPRRVSLPLTETEMLCF
jgi:hypothetical protein